MVDELERRLLEEAYDGNGVVNRGAPEDDAAYAEFEEEVEALLDLRRRGLFRTTTAPDGMRGRRKYFKASATITEEGRDLVEQLRGKR